MEKRSVSPMGAVNPADHMGLVWNVAKQYGRRSTIPIEDLVQEGCIGLMQACRKFDPTRGVAFSTYGVWWISAYIGRAIKYQAQTVHVPPLQREHVKFGYVSMDAPCSEGGEDTRTLHDVLESDIEDVDDDAARDELKEIVWAEVDTLPKKLRAVLRLRFLEGWTLEEVGTYYGVTREAIRQTELKALAALRPKLEAAL